MWQLSPAVRSVLLSVLSLVLFPVAWMLLGRGSAFADTVTIVAVPLGTAAFSASLVIAVRSRQQWLLAIVVTLGVILCLGALVNVIGNIEYPMPNKRWIPFFVIAVLVVDCVGLAVFFRARRRAAANQHDSATPL